MDARFGNASSKGQIYFREKKKKEMMNRVKTYCLITNVQVRINVPNFVRHTTMQHIIVII